MKKQDLKCAPSKTYSDGSCLTEKSLKKITENYNKKNKDKINPNLEKKQLVKILEEKLSDKCSEQTCWLRLDFVKELENNDILHDTFRPKGPSKKYDWLNTDHIDEVIEQYQTVHKDFLFLGAVPYDFEELKFLGIYNLDFNDLLKKNKTKIGLVINLDEHDKPGSHWVALYADLIKNQIYFSDSVGRKPLKRIRIFITKIFKFLYQRKFHSIPSIDQIKENNTNIEGFDIRYNNKQQQQDDSECGVYSVNFIIHLVSGETFNDIISNPINDEDMNKYRKEYFRNVN